MRPALTRPTGNEPGNAAGLEIIMPFKDGGIKIYSQHTSQARTLVSGSLSIGGVAHDVSNGKIHYSTHSSIHRINLNGSGDERLFSSSKCQFKYLQG